MDISTVLREHPWPQKLRTQNMGNLTQDILNTGYRVQDTERGKPTGKVRPGTQEDIQLPRSADIPALLCTLTHTATYSVS